MFFESWPRTSQRKSNTFLIKIGLMGILIPCYQETHGHHFRYKLGTETSEYLLSMSDDLLSVAEGASWDEVSVMGNLDLRTHELVVEEIIPKCAQSQLGLDNLAS